MRHVVAKAVASLFLVFWIASCGPPIAQVEQRSDTVTAAILDEGLAAAGRYLHSPNADDPVDDALVLLRVIDDEVGHLLPIDENKAGPPRTYYFMGARGGKTGDWDGYCRQSETVSRYVSSAGYPAVIKLDFCLAEATWVLKSIRLGINTKDPEARSKWARVIERSQRISGAQGRENPK